MVDQIPPSAVANCAVTAPSRTVAGDALGEDALGTALRDAYRAIARALQNRIAPHGVGMGQWFFLRVLWEQDGLTQRELSQRVGMMEPTTVTALNSMERRGLVVRKRNSTDRRKVNIFLTPKGRALRDVLLPLAAEVQSVAAAEIPPGMLTGLLETLGQMTRNLDRDSSHRETSQGEEDAAGDPLHGAGAGADGG